MTTYEWVGLVATGAGLVLGYLMGRADGRQLGVTQETLRELREPPRPFLKPDVILGSPEPDQDSPDWREQKAELRKLVNESASNIRRIQRAANATVLTTDEAAALRGKYLERAEASTELARPRGSPEAQALRLADQMAQCQKGDDRDVYPDW